MSVVRVGASAASVREARKGVLDILNAQVENKTKRAALKFFAEITSVNQTTISNCTFTSGSKRDGRND